MTKFYTESDLREWANRLLTEHGIRPIEMSERLRVGRATVSKALSGDHYAGTKTLVRIIEHLDGGKLEKQTVFSYKK